MHVQLEKLRRRRVVDATGTIVGRVREPLVDMETWLIDALRVTPTRHAAEELGLAWSWWWWKRPTIDVPTGQVQAASETVILRIALGELREAHRPMVQLDDPEPVSIH
ncbi:MAG TPA: PRC-barrel domain containing protein [Polyangia bacterium]|nr:PRC-barrel domain containing protein [Polyangia bacterium]